VANPRPRVETVAIIDRLDQQHPNADTELNYRTPFELLIATILSAQSTDARVNLVTPTLFAKYPDARALAAAESEAVEPLIVSTGFFRSKARSIVGAARALVERHDGQVPADMTALVELPGVGRKTANVVLGHALGVPGLPVDRHVLRVANRLGIATSDVPEVVEKQLCAAMPPKRWTRTSDVLILHGRRVCRPTPMCDRCSARELCHYYAALSTPPAARARKAKAPAKGGHSSGPAPKRTGKRSSR
jgi:endonuclease III